MVPDTRFRGKLWVRPPAILTVWPRTMPLFCIQNSPNLYALLDAFPTLSLRLAHACRARTPGLPSPWPSPAREKEWRGPRPRGVPFGPPACSRYTCAMSQEPDYYAILQVHPNAEPEVIDAAYRRLAAKYHPDVNSSPDATARMQQINEAHRVLSDPARRAAYDARRAHADAPSVRRSAPRSDPWRQVRSYVGWFLALVLLGEVWARVGSRGFLLLLVLGGVFYLLWRSRRVF